MEADNDGMHRLGLNKETEIGMIISEPGFEPYEKDDGLHPTPGYLHRNEVLSYNKWVNDLGYEGANPWNDYVSKCERVRQGKKSFRIVQKHLIGDNLYKAKRGVNEFAKYIS